MTNDTDFFDGDYPTIDYDVTTYPWDDEVVAPPRHYPPPLGPDDAHNIWRVAWHEAGHAIALELRGEPWTATVIPEDGLLGHVQAHIPRLDRRPHTEAFFLWAGSYAEARGYWHTRDWPALPRTAPPAVGPGLSGAVEKVCESLGSRYDMATLDVYRMGYEPGRQSEGQWARELDQAWGRVRDLALRLATEGTVTSE